MKAYAAILFVTLLPTLAHADAYDDRQRMNEQRQSQSQIQVLQARYAKLRLGFFTNLSAFGKKHGGFAQLPECTAGFESDSHSIWNRVTKECNAGVCANVHGESDGLFNRHANDLLYQQISLQDSVLSSCKVLLNNGLACEISDDWDKHTFGGNCLDANGRSQDLSVKAVDYRPEE